MNSPPSFSSFTIGILWYHPDRVATQAGLVGRTGYIDQTARHLDDLASQTPFRRQYLQLKQRYPDAILLFRMGDFYEAFDADAKTIASELDIVLTGRDAARG